MPRMPDCGGLMIGVASSEPNTPPLVIVNVPPESSCSDKFAVARRRGESLDLAFDLRERHLVRVAQDWHG